MAENLCCEESGCGQSAHVFGFVCGRKWKCCEAHVLSLINKKATVYDIAAFAFINSPRDGSFYEERRVLMQQGLGNVASLMTECEKDWEEGQRRVQETCDAVFQMAQRSFTEIWHRGNERYQEVKKDLGELRSRLERLVQDREFQLSPGDLAVCESVKAGPVFRMLLGDCATAVVEALISNLSVLSWDIQRESQMDWAVKLRAFAGEQAEKGRADVAREAYEFAHQLGANGPRVMDSEVKLIVQSFFPCTAKPEAEMCLKAGQAATEAGHYDKAVEELQRGLDLLCGAGGSELHLQLSNALAENYVLIGRLGDAELLCDCTLQFWTNKTKYGFEFIRALFCLSVANDVLFVRSDSLHDWNTNLSADISRSQIVYLTCQNPTAESIEKELLLGQSASFMTIWYRFLLPSLYVNEGRLEEAEKALALAVEQFPKASVFETNCLMFFSIQYESMGLATESEQKLKAAKQLAAKHSYTELLTAMQQYYGPQVAQEASAVMVQAQAAQEFFPAAEAFVAYPEMAFTPTCVICCERNSPTKRWRKYMPEKYKDKISLFGLVCRLDCLDELINRSEQVAPVKEEVGENTCGLCRTHIERRHNVCMLQCNHMICGWQCLVAKLLKRPKVLQCACSFEISSRARKEILQKCKYPLNTFCLSCKQNTNRTAKCQHPICKECADSDGIPLTQHCVVCSKSPQ